MTFRIINKLLRGRVLRQIARFVVKIILIGGEAVGRRVNRRIRDVVRLGERGGRVVRDIERAVAVTVTRESLFLEIAVVPAILAVTLFITDRV